MAAPWLRVRLAQLLSALELMMTLQESARQQTATDAPAATAGVGHRVALLAPQMLAVWMKR
jgi:hypothetical protein